MLESQLFSRLVAGAAGVVCCIASVLAWICRGVIADRLDKFRTTIVGKIMFPIVIGGSFRSDTTMVWSLVGYSVLGFFGIFLIRLAVTGNP